MEWAAEKKMHLVDIGIISNNFFKFSFNYAVSYLHDLRDPFISMWIRLLGSFQEPFIVMHCALTITLRLRQSRVLYVCFPFGYQMWWQQPLVCLGIGWPLFLFWCIWIGFCNFFLFLLVHLMLKSRNLYL